MIMEDYVLFFFFENIDGGKYMRIQESDDDEDYEEEEEEDEEDE